MAKLYGENNMLPWPWSPDTLWAQSRESPQNDSSHAVLNNVSFLHSSERWLWASWEPISRSVIWCGWLRMGHLNKSPGRCLSQASKALPQSLLLVLCIFLSQYPLCHQSTPRGIEGEPDHVESTEANIERLRRFPAEVISRHRPKLMI